MPVTIIILHFSESFNLPLAGPAGYEYHDQHDIHGSRAWGTITCAGGPLRLDICGPDFTLQKGAQISASFPDPWIAYVE